MEDEQELPNPNQQLVQREDRQKNKKQNRTLADDIKLAKNIYNKAKKIKAIISAMNPWVLLVIVIVFVIIMLLFFFSSSPGDDGSSQKQPAASAPGGTSPTTIPGLTITLTGPDSIENGADIPYRVSIIYDKTRATIPIEDIEIYDNIPQQSTFKDTDGIKGSNSSDTSVTWPLREFQNQSGFGLTLHPSSDDIYITNTVTARVIGGGSSSGGSGGSGGPSQTFSTLVKGEGRNVPALGDKSSFVATIIAHSSGLPLAGKEDYLSKIYDAGVQYGVSPLILTVVWGVESSFDAGGGSIPYPFGCLNPTDAGFDENVTCAAGSLNQLMKTFENNNVNGSLEIPSTIGNTCIYTDAFDYAYEMYTPVCHASDSNDPARANFISFYRQLKGL